VDHLEGRIVFRYLVEAELRGKDYLIHCPSLGVRRYVADAQTATLEKLEGEAREMIGRCGGAVKDFKVDLQVKRVGEKKGMRLV
jgi:hypothetical protein